MIGADYDLLVIGGGINGAGIARDASGRGLSVLLVEQGDLASGTSSASTKLIHGGLRYLEHFEFRLVNAGLSERERLLTLAPHLVHPLEFVLPHDKLRRPVWLVRLGLFIYDRMAGSKKLLPSKSVSLKDSPLADSYKIGFSYADCQVDDSRLTVLNAVSAAEHGATILTRTKCTGLGPDTGKRRWVVRLGRGDTVTARMIVNAAGPWVRQVLEESGLASPATPRIRLVKGSHIIVKQVYEGRQAYILQQPGRRIVFVIPYQNGLSLVGTTEVDFGNVPGPAMISHTEMDYLVNAVNRSFKNKIKPEDILWTFSGIRPLIDTGETNPRAVSRDYKLILDESHGAPLLSVFSGKITTYRLLAEQAVDMLTGAPAWTAAKPLPGGEIPGFENFVENRIEKYSHAVPPEVVRRYAGAYGSLMDTILQDGPGRDLGDGIYEAEIRYLVEKEWAQNAEDILWRRSKLGLHITAETAHNLDVFLRECLRQE